MFLPVAAVALDRRPQRCVSGDGPLIVFIPVDQHIHNFHHTKILIFHHIFLSVEKIHGGSKYQPAAKRKREKLAGCPVLARELSRPPVQITDQYFVKLNTLVFVFFLIQSFLKKS